MTLHSREILPTMDVSASDLPPRSRLFALAPEGLGADRVEGLTSYLTRLACAHAVSPRRLIREEVAKALPNKGCLGSAARRMCDASTLDGLDAYAEGFAAATAQLTTVPEVRWLTLLPLAGVLPSSGAGIVARHPRWCPECFAEAMEEGREPSRPLVWSLRLYRVCHRHRREMLEVCGRCGKPQPFVPRFPDVCRPPGRRHADRYRPVQGRQ